MVDTHSSKLLSELFETAGIEINGQHPWDITINDTRFYQRIFRQPHLTLGEGYMNGWWDCPSIDRP